MKLFTPFAGCSQPRGPLRCIRLRPDPGPDCPRHTRQGLYQNAEKRQNRRRQRLHPRDEAEADDPREKLHEDAQKRQNGQSQRLHPQNPDEKHDARHGPQADDVGTEYAGTRHFQCRVSLTPPLIPPASSHDAHET